MKKGVVLKDLRFVAKRVVSKQTYKTIQAIKDPYEQQLLYEYAIKSSLELTYAQLKEKVAALEHHKKDTFILRTKLHLLGSKVHFFHATYQKEDFKTLMKLLTEIEKEMKKI